MLAIRNNSMVVEKYLTLATESQAEFKDRGSKFLAFAYPILDVDDVKKSVKKLKEIHPKAVHFCFAYRLGIDGNNYRANDDGEPSGSAGKPILAQIDSAGLTNVCVIVVRYWGGVLLGVPGLIQAYKNSAEVAISQNQLVEKYIQFQVVIECNYTQLDYVMRIVKKFDAEILNNDMSLFCSLKLSVPLKFKSEFLAQFENLFEVKLNLI